MLKSALAERIAPLPLDIAAVSDLIRGTQKENGEIPWSAGDKTDPWDHVESAMGLTIAGHHDLARKAFRWLAGTQLDDGSWFSAYRNGAPEDRTRDTNMSSYIAVGLYHYWLITGDIDFVERMWETMAAGIGFAVSMQAASGEIHWAKSPEGVTDPMALLTGSSSVYLSLKCAIAIARLLKKNDGPWVAAKNALGAAIRHKPYRFNAAKARFSMDWFYPVLAGAITGDEARRRIAARWGSFVVDGRGVRCVSDEPWVTVAETSELVLTLAAMGDHRRAATVYGWLADACFADNTYWCGYTVPDLTVWPEEKITWTNAVVLMAADALYDLTPASRLFSHEFWTANG